MDLIFLKITRFFVSNPSLKLAKNQAIAKQHSEAERFLHPRCHLKIIRYILKNVQRNKSVCLNEAIRLMAMKMRLNMKNGSYRYDINRPRPRHGHRYTKYKIRLSTIIVIWLLSNT